MAGAFENQKTGVRILFGVIIGILALSMLLYLVPQGTNTAETSTDVVAQVGDQSVTLAEIHAATQPDSPRQPDPHATRRALCAADPQSARLPEGS